MRRRLKAASDFDDVTLDSTFFIGHGLQSGKSGAGCNAGRNLRRMRVRRDVLQWEVSLELRRLFVLKAKVAA